MRCVSCSSKFEILGPKDSKTSMVGLQNMDGDQRYWSRLGRSRAAAVTSTHQSDGRHRGKRPTRNAIRYADMRRAAHRLAGSRQNPFPRVSQRGNIPAVYGHNDSSQTSKTEIFRNVFLASPK